MSKGEDGGQTAGVFQVERAWREEDRSMEDGATSHSHARARASPGLVHEGAHSASCCLYAYSTSKDRPAQGLCTCRPPAWGAASSSPSFLRLGSVATLALHPTRPPVSALQHATVHFPRGHNCSSERSWALVCFLCYCLPPTREDGDLRFSSPLLLGPPCWGRGQCSRWLGSHTGSAHPVDHGT